MAHTDARPLLFIVSGPSGAGKGTALRALASEGVRRVATFATRPMRDSETDGVDYNFVSDEAFFAAYDSGEIFEYTRTYSQSYYGSPTSLLRADIGEPIASEMDPTGFVSVRAATARRVVGLFVATSEETVLRERIDLRGQGNEVQQRLKVRTDQMTWAWMYDYIIFNDDSVEQFLENVATIVGAEKLKTEAAVQMLELKTKINPTLRGV